MLNKLRARLLGEDPEVARFKAWAGWFVLWVGAGVFSCDEVRYRVGGAAATAERVKMTESGFGQPVRATYRWRDAETGERRNKVIEFEGTFPPPQLEVQYIPGGLNSRPAAAASWFMPGVFLGLTLLAGGWIEWTAISDRRR